LWAHHAVRQSIKEEPMSKATATVEVHNTSTCPCDFNMDPEAHDRLLGVEILPPMDAIELVAELAMCEVHPGFDAGDFSRFAGQHNWTNPAVVGRLAMLLDDLSAGYCR
jgi:hypothetical protein